MSVRFWIETPPAPGAVGVIRVSGAGLFGVLGCAPVDAGCSGVRRLLDLDEALVAALDHRTAMIMPHGGPAVMRSIAQALVGRGAVWEPDSGIEGQTVEHRMMTALASAPSPLAIDLLLDQPRRWAKRGEADGLADGDILGRLLKPAVVVAVGAPNIGKSSLLNALAGREAALAFDLAGTTRDAVGVMLDCAGLVVRWVDTPGLDGPASQGVIEKEIASADLALMCRDAGHPPLALEVGATPVLEVVTRCDLGSDGSSPGGIRTSAAVGEGLATLVAAIREVLVPDEILRDRRAWRFWA